MKSFQVHFIGFLLPFSPKTNAYCMHSPCYNSSIQTQKLFIMIAPKFIFLNLSIFKLTQINTHTILFYSATFSKFLLNSILAKLPQNISFHNWPYNLCLYMYNSLPFSSTSHFLP